MIVAEVKPSQKCDDEYSVFLTFNYNPQIIAKIKDYPERYWLPENKCWEMPIKYFNKFRWNCEEDILKIIDDEKRLEAFNETTKEVNVDIPDNYQFKTKPYKHQVEGIQYGLNHNCFLLGDEQGLGKTMQVINIACIKKELYGYKHCLIICGVNGLKWNWQAEVEKHSNEHAYILGTRLKGNDEYIIGSVQDRLNDLQQLLPVIQVGGQVTIEELERQKKLKSSYFIITNIETLRNDEVQKLLKELCKKEIINMIAFDEFHKCKNPSSQQGKAILKLQAPNMVAMTGTPLMNNPVDLYMPLRWLGFEEHNFYQFKNHYCEMGGFGGYQIVGYKNMGQLRTMLEECTLRRLKQQVLDLPEKIYTNEFVEMGPKQAKIYNEVKMEIKDNIDKVKNSINPLAEMIRLRQATGYTGILSSKIQESAKFDRLLELVEEAIANDDKVLIFSNWLSITNPLFDMLKQYNPAIITGQTKDRVAQQDKFMKSSECKVLIGTTGAMGTGLTLTAARTVIFLDEPWNRALKEQAEDRAHRIGTTGTVNIITLLCKDTIDERIHELVERKGKIADILVDGRLVCDDKGELVDFLLS